MQLRPLILAVSYRPVYTPSLDPAPINAATQKEGQMKRIYVGNVNLGACEDSVRLMFEKYGSVDRVSIATNRDTGARRAFGFVEMSNNSEADLAISELNERELDGRTLIVIEALPNEECVRRRSHDIFRTQSRNNRY